MADEVSRGRQLPPHDRHPRPHPLRPRELLKPKRKRRRRTGAQLRIHRLDWGQPKPKSELDARWHKPKTRSKRLAGIELRSESRSSGPDLGVSYSERPLQIDRRPRPA